jgi:hypothetical protein
MPAPSERLIRRVLWASAVFNLGGALLFAFPAAPPGQLAGLPPEAPPLYRATVAMFVLLFSGAYAWLASQPTIVRPMLAFGAIGKASFFLLMLAFWLLDAIPGQGLLGAAGDLALAAAMGWWLLASRNPGAVRPR